MEKIVLFNSYHQELKIIDLKNINSIDAEFLKEYNEYLNYDKHIGKFEYIHSISDALRDDLITITKENIHLYYEFMSDEDIKKHKEILNISFRARNEVIEVHFCIDLLTVNSSKFIFDNCYLIGSSLFGVKDTLRPIDDYIQDIKASSEYKEYISKNILTAYIDKDRSNEIDIIISFDKKREVDIEVSSIEMADYVVSCFNDLKSNNSDDIFEIIEEYFISQGI